MIFAGNYQLVWNSTSLDAFKACAYRYKLAILDGWSTGSENIHIHFGLAYHKAIEVYHFQKAKLISERAEGLMITDGEIHEVSVRAAVRQAMTMTWPDILNDKYKSRPNLIRSIVWYLEEFRDDGIETLILANGQPAVEVTFALDLGIESPTGDSYVLAGHLDRIGTFLGDMYYTDLKSTQSALGDYYFDRYSPHNQMSTYSYAGRVHSNLPLKGGIIDACQVLVNGSRFQRGFVNRTPDQLEEWREDLQVWLDLAAVYAKREYWPMNDTACMLCNFKSICKLDPAVRQSFLRSNFTKRVIDPLAIRT